MADQRKHFDEGDARVLFSLGRTIVSDAANETVGWLDIKRAVRRHGSGDWGEVWSERKKENDSAVHEGGEVFSIYLSASNIRFCVITDLDRRRTRVVLAEER